MSEETIQMPREVSKTYVIAEIEMVAVDFRGGSNPNGKQSDRKHGTYYPAYNL